MKDSGPDPYRELFERSADAILIIEDNRFVDCNAATVAMLRYQNKEDLLRTHPSELSPPRQPDGRSSFEKANEMMATAFERGSHRFEWDHVRFDGEVFPVEVLLTAVQRDDKRILHVVWRDITDRKRLEEQLRHSQKMEIIGQLTGGIAHDFNNLLVAIMGNGELLQRKLQDRPELVVFVEEMVKAGRRGAALVRQLLLFSRPQDSPAELIDLVPVLRDVHRMLERLIGENVRLVIESHPEPLLTGSSRGHIEQVVVNLVTNARDAMPNGGTITVGLKPVSIAKDSIGAVEQLDPGRYALLSVTDTGHGMSDEVLAHAIDPFFTTKDVGRGTGLGLSTVYGIAKQSGGGLRIDSSVGHGSTVKVYLPLRQGVPATPEPPAVPRPVRGGDERILVAEDDETVAKVVVRALTARGYRVELASDGAQALERCLARRGDVDLLVTDVVMPRMNGPELVRALRAEGIGVPVLFMSGYTRDEALPPGDGDGPVELLEKPFTATELVTRVREVLDRGAEDAAAD
ncbi:MAG: response regulator [Polyangiaceae bacterium]|nr:response regulator [Polyangiaceae bacterium]MCL4754085.1 response regulator [Myxococcales bacterium]